MSGLSSRSYLTIASAIIIAAVLISTSVFVASGERTTTGTVTTIATLTTTSTVTTTSTLTKTNTATVTLTRTITPNVPCPSNTTCAPFTYAPTGQVQVLSVQATQQIAQNGGAANGGQVVVFGVTFANTGNSSIYIPDGSNGVSASIPANSSVIREVGSEVCPGTFAIVRLNQGQNYTLYAPSCFTGYNYRLVQAGSVNVSFSFNWTTNPNASTNPTDFPNSTTISATFTFT